MRSVSLAICIQLANAHIDGKKTILFADLLISDAIIACYAANPTQHLCLYCGVAFIVFVSRPVLRTMTKLAALR